MKISTTRVRIWFCSRGFNTQLNIIFSSLDILKVWSFACPFIKYNCNTSLFSACTAWEKEWRSVIAGYVNGLTLLSINQNLQAVVDRHDDTRAYGA